MLNKIKNLSRQKHIEYFFLATIILFYAVALTLSSPMEILQGFKKIVLSRDVLITDYFVIGGYGPAFFNSATVMLISYLMIKGFKLNFVGMSIASVMIMGGFALFGKEPLNILPIIIGTIIYSKVQGVKSGRYIYVGFLATGVSPIITELVKILEFSLPINIAISITVGVAIGYIIVPLSSHTVGVHMGYNIFNVGFAVGLIALAVMEILLLLGYKCETVLFWKSGRPLWLIILLYSYFALMLLYGLFLNDFKMKNYKDILKHPGRAVADFILMDGEGLTFINMAFVGMVALTYILLIGGDLSGPTIGAILTVSGFGAFGIHPKNYIPVLLGVFIASLVGICSANEPSLQLAAVFSGALAPIAGQFGVIAGVIAGFLHSAIVVNVGFLYSGMNLYNNGFSAGLVALLMVPILESFIKRYKSKE